MEFVLIKPNGVIAIYHSLRRLCVENGLDPSEIKKDMLPMTTKCKLKIYGLIPDTRI